jgi:putative transposase
MTHRRDSSAKHAESAFYEMDEIVGLLQTAENPIAAILSFLMNRAMILERTKHLCADKHERTVERRSYANGYKDRSLKTRLGKLELKVPQVRNSDEPFYPSSLNAAMLSETALHVALAEMYVHGVATRKVKGVLEKVCGFGISAMEVSRAVKNLDDVLDAWRNCRLRVIPFVQFDALWCKVRQRGLVQAAAVLIASGIPEDGK